MPNTMEARMAADSIRVYAERDELGAAEAMVEAASAVENRLWQDLQEAEEGDFIPGLIASEASASASRELAEARRDSVLCAHRSAAAERWAAYTAQQENQVWAAAQT